MQPDLAISAVLACSLGVATALSVAARLFFPGFFPRLATRACFAAFLVMMVVRMFSHLMPGWTAAFFNYYFFGCAVGLLLVILLGVIAFLYFARLKLRATQLREYTAVHRHLTRHHRD